MATLYDGYSSVVISRGNRRAGPPVRRNTSDTSALQLAAVRLPGTTASTRRCSGSIATWSQLSPTRSSPASPGPTLSCFFATNDHFSSICTSAVRGGKGEQLVVQRLRLPAGLEGQPADRLAVDPRQPGGLPLAAPLGQVLQHRDRRLRRQPGVEQRRALALAEAGLAGAAVQQAERLALAVGAAHREVPHAPPAVQGAPRILAAETRKVLHRVVHDRPSPWPSPRPPHLTPPAGSFNLRGPPA